MNKNAALTAIPEAQVRKFRDRIEELVQCCQTRTAYIAQRVELAQSEVRFLMLFQGERYLTVKGIAARLDVAKSRVTKILQGLQSKGFVESIPDPRDARIKLISLTARGRQKVEEISELIMSIHARILSELPLEDRSSVLASLDTLWTSMETVKKEMA